MYRLWGGQEHRNELEVPCQIRIDNAYSKPQQIDHDTFGKEGWNTTSLLQGIAIELRNDIPQPAFLCNTQNVKNYASQSDKNLRNPGPDCARSLPTSAQDRTPQQPRPKPDGNMKGCVFCTANLG
jgi:hypothetical protein